MLLTETVAAVVAVAVALVVALFALLPTLWQAQRRNLRPLHRVDAVAVAIAVALVAMVACGNPQKCRIRQREFPATIESNNSRRPNRSLCRRPVQGYL